MPANLYVGPYDFVPVGTTTQAPWYVIPFDKRGRCTGPLTREHLVKSIREGELENSRTSTCSRTVGTTTGAMRSAMTQRA